jgi:hypothetical protein
VLKKFVIYFSQLVGFSLTFENIVSVVYISNLSPACKERSPVIGIKTTSVLIKK